MKIEIKEGNIFESDCEALVNAVNCIGIMGAGLAKQFRLKYPEMMHSYQTECKEKVLKIGQPHYFSANDGKMIINFPTMHNPGSQSKLEDIKLGLLKLKQDLKDFLNLKSIAFCSLGCGVGGLYWEDVFNLIKEIFDDGDINIEFFKPYM